MIVRPGRVSIQPSSLVVRDLGKNWSLRRAVRTGPPTNLVQTPDEQRAFRCRYTVDGT